MSMTLVVAILLVVFVLGPIARAYAARVERGADRGALPGGGPEVARLREEVDRLGAEVARLSEEQAFVLKLLAPGEASSQEGGKHQGTLKPPPGPA